MDVSENSGTPKSSISIGFSIINHPIWGTPYFWKHPYVGFSLIPPYNFADRLKLEGFGLNFHRVCKPEVPECS